MDTTYKGEHSIIFGNRHTWEDWGLVPSSRPSVVLPSVKTNTIEIPGMNGVLDLSDIPFGTVTYGNRSGSWKFNIAHDKNGLTWSETFSLISSYLHGKKKQCILTDDRSYYYEGRFTVDAFNSGKNFSDITIKYDLKPFKYMIWTTTEDWLWDPFDLIYGNITQAYFKNVMVSGTKTLTWSQNEIGEVPVTPKFEVVSSDFNGLTISVENTYNGIGEQTFELVDGTNQNEQIMFYCPDPDDSTIIKISGTGSISIDFRPGRL